MAGLNERYSLLQLIALRGTVGPEEAFAVPAAVETSVQIGYIFVECIYCFFAEVDGLEGGCGETKGRQDETGQTKWPH